MKLFLLSCVAATASAFFQNKQPTLAAAAAAAAGVAPPVMPSSWSAESEQKIIVFQGGIYNATDATACCEIGASQCKVQAQGLAGSMYVDSALNATTFSVGQEAEIKLFNQGKDIIATPAAGGKGWNCTSYCPMQGDEFSNPIAISAKAKDAGAKNVSGKTLEEFIWNDELIVIKMDENDAYVDLSDASNPVPVSYIEKLTPFGGPEIAVSTNDWDTFVPKTPSASQFDVVNLGSCPQGDNCNNNNQNKKNFARRLQQKTHPTLAELARAEVAKHAPLDNDQAAAPAAADGAEWAKDFTTHTSDVMVINQGGFPSADGKAVCCQASFVGQCQIQLQSNIGQLYHDYTNQRSRFDNEAAGVTFVDDFKTHKSMQVVQNGSALVCQSYCPLDPEETLQGGRDYFLDPNATDLGNVTYKGHAAHKWEWSETIFKVVKMQTTDFFAASDGKAYTPLAAVTQLTPFGQHLGTDNQVWTDFSPGTPPASKFDVQGAADCPQNPQCGQQSWQMHRLARRQLHTFARYQEILPRN